VQTLPLEWSHVRLTVNSSKLTTPLTHLLPTAGTQVTAEFMVPPGEATVTAEMLLSAAVVATGSASASVSPGTTQGVEIVMQTSRTTVETASGLGAPYLGDGKAANFARLSYPSAMAVDAGGNLYVADLNHHRIRRIDAAPPHTVTTVAGHLTPLSGPKSLALDGAGNLYFTENGNSFLRRLNLATGELTTLLTGLSGSHSLVFRGGFLYISDPTFGRILKVDVATSAVSEYVGNSAPFQGLTITLSSPQGLALTPDGNGLYIAENGTHKVHKVDLLTHTMVTVAGSGTAGTPSAEGIAATVASITNPEGLAVDSLGNVYIAAKYGHEVYRVDAAGNIYTVAGNGTPGFGGDGGAATAAMLEHPGALVVEPGGGLLIADVTNNRIRRVFGAAISTFAGNGNVNFFGGDEQLGVPFAEAAFDLVERVAVDESGNVYVADPTNHRIRVLAYATESRYGLNLVAGRVYTVVGTGLDGLATDGVRGFESPLGTPRGLVLDTAGHLYVSDSTKNIVIKVDRITGQISRLAGSGASGFMDGSGSVAMFSSPEGMAYSATTSQIFVADRMNHRIRAISLPGGNVSTFAGTGTSGLGGDSGPTNVAQFNRPTDVALDAAGNLFVADSDNHKVRMICQAAGNYFGVTMAAGNIYRVAGLSTGTGGYPPSEVVAGVDSPLSGPRGVEVDMAGNLLIADTGNNRVRFVDRTNGVISALVGFQSGYADGLGAMGGDFGVARLWLPTDVARSASGSLYIADQSNYAIRLALPPGL
jgi:DNA-binding beta-propeller fold protein YncE